MAILKATIVASIESEAPASSPEELMRKGEVDAALAGKADLVHTHAAEDVTGLQSGIQTHLGSVLASTNTVVPTVSDESVSFDLRVNPLGALTSDGDGLRVAVGMASGLVAPGDHTHPTLHDPVTVVPGYGIALAMDEQELSAEVVLAPNGGLALGGSGLGVSFGTGATDVAAGNHTHAGMHAAVTVIDTASVAFALTGQELTAAVRFDPDPDGGVPLAESADGVYAPTGPSGVAPYEHTHGNASTSTAGFLSAFDKDSLDTVADLRAMEIPIGFRRERPLVVGERLDGQCRFSRAMKISRLDCTALAPESNTRIVLEVDGNATDVGITIPAGPSGVEVTAQSDVSNYQAGVDATCRWLVSSGPSSGVAAAAVALNMNVYPVWPANAKYNAGGLAVSPYANDYGFDGGSVVSTSHSIATAGLSDPAPESVYQSQRSRSSDLKYRWTSKLRGLTYRVRLHLAELVHASAGARVFDIVVSGVESQTISDVDVYSLAGGRYAGVIVEPDDLVSPGADGAIAVTFKPKVDSAVINGIEVLYVE